MEGAEVNSEIKGNKMVGVVLLACISLPWSEAWYDDVMCGAPGQLRRV